LGEFRLVTKYYDEWSEACFKISFGAL